MEAGGTSLLQVILAFAVVFALLGAFGFGLRYVSARGMKMPGLSGRNKRLEVIETLTLDVRRRLVIVRCDDKEHLVLLGVNNDLVVDANVTAERAAP